MIVRTAELCDLGAIAQIHVEAFEDFFLTRLGPTFLREYYRTVLEYQAGIMLVASTTDTETQGFAAGFANPLAFYRFLRSRRLRLAIAALPGLLRRPSLFARTVGSARRVARGNRHVPSASEVELSSIAAAPSAQRKGLGTTLTRAFISRSRVMGARRVSLTTDADGNDPVNRFYLSLGFQISQTFQSQRRRRMHCYSLILDGVGESIPGRKAA